MRKLTMSAIGAAAVLSFALPATANAQWGHHDRQHEQLDEEHGDVHEQLEEEHAEAHAQGLSPWEHAQLHQDLQNQHENADYAIELQHQREHMRDQWHRQYQGYANQNDGRGYGRRGYGYSRHRRSGVSVYYGY